MGRAKDRPITMPAGALTRAERLRLARGLRGLLEEFRRAIVEGDREAAHAAASAAAMDAELAAAIARSRAALGEARAVFAEGAQVLAALEAPEHGAEG